MENSFVNSIIINGTETQIQDYGRDQPNGVPVLDAQRKLPTKYIPEENKRTINPATGIDFSTTNNEEVNFYKLSLDLTSIEGIKSALITYGFHTVRTGTSIIEFIGPGGQRFTVILSHSGKDYFGGIVITFYFPLTYLRYNNGTWE